MQVINGIKFHLLPFVLLDKAVFFGGTH